MTARQAVPVFIAAACLLSATARAGQGAPPRDATDQPTVGTGAISGVVMADDSGGKPLRKAAVMLSASEIRGSRTTTTDDAGRFTFTSLPRGRYSLSATKVGYIRSQYGARIGQTSSQPVLLGDGQQLGGLTIKLTRAAVVTGILTDAGGRPVSNVHVTMLQYRFVNGQRVLSSAPGAGPVNGSTTDDRGVYRLYGLTPGDYVILAQPQAGAMSEVHLITRADIQWAQQQLQRAASAAPGGAVTSPGAEQVQSPAPAGTVGYAPMYYPGTPDPRAAATVTLTAGEERTGLDFPIPLVMTARIEGTVLDPGGRLLRDVRINLTRDGQPTGVGTEAIILNGPDGTFSASGLSPGHYVLTARTNPPPPPGGMSPITPPAPAMPVTGPAEIMWALTEVDINGRDLTGLTLNLQPAMTAAGRVTFDATTMPAPQDMRQLRLTLSPASPSAGLTAPMSVAAIQPDGTLLFKGLTPGTYRFSASVGTGPRGGGPAAGWVLKSVRVDGRDLTDLPITIKPNDQLTLAVTFSDRPSEVSGRLLDASGRPSSAYSIVIFSADHAYWGLQSRRTVQFRPDEDGNFRIVNLPAGDYYLSAVMELDATDMANPAFFEQLVPASFRITLAEGEKKVQDLRLAGGH